MFNVLRKVSARNYFQQIQTYLKLFIISIFRLYLCTFCNSQCIVKKLFIFLLKIPNGRFLLQILYISLFICLSGFFFFFRGKQKINRNVLVFILNTFKTKCNLYGLQITTAAFENDVQKVHWSLTTTHKGIWIP